MAHVMVRNVRMSEILIECFDQPAVVLAGYVNQVLDSETLLKELVREADVEWLLVASYGRLKKLRQRVAKGCERMRVLRIRVDVLPVRYAAARRAFVPSSSRLCRRWLIASDARRRAAP